MSIYIKLKVMEEIELSLADFLKSKPLYYSEIDYTRMPRAYASIKDALHVPKIIHIMGTNGKGTTGRFLATALYNAGYKVGHYSSPHIIKFNERIYLNGADVADEVLEDAHTTLQTLLNDEFLETLSYFEYTTFLAMIVYASCDYVVLEAGLGGEHDATSVFEDVLTVYTPIDMDHEAFLGDTLESVASTKLRAMGKEVLIASQRHYLINTFAINIAKSYNSTLHFVDDIQTKVDTSLIETIAKKLGLARYLKENLSTAISALYLLGVHYDVESFDGSHLFGRLMKIDENITLDVGHNTLAAKAIKEALCPQKVVLIYNSFSDKNYAEVLKILDDIVLHVELLHVKDSRIAPQEDIEAVLDTLEIQHRVFEKIDKTQKYLVFGSFSVAEVFLGMMDEESLYDNLT